MSFYAKLLKVSLACIFILSSLPVVAEVLQGGIEHSENMPPVEPALRAGAIFNESVIQSLSAEEGWYWVPAWMVGSWHRETETKCTWLGNFTHLSRTDKFCGKQRDRNGEYWDYYLVPYLQPVDAGPFIEYKIMRGYFILPSEPGTFTIRYVSTCIRVDKRTRRIFSSHNQEDINRYSPYAPGVLRNDGSLRAFDAAGRPSKPVKCFYFATMMQPFQPLNYLNGKDMRLSFRNYLLTHGLAELIPDDLR